MPSFEATTDFASALLEVDLLVQAAASSGDEPDTENALNKAAILLLTAKMEAFIEQIIEEFCYRLSELRLACERLPTTVRVHASRRLLNSDIMAALERSNEGKIIPCMEALTLLWRNGCTPTELMVDCSFTYGKHGEKEIRRLFQRIGVADVFASCKIADDRETLDDAGQELSYAITSDVNALTGYRNYIIHNDGTPSVTHVQIDRYRNRLFAFARRVDEHLSQMKETIQAAPTTGSSAPR